MTRQALKNALEKLRTKGPDKKLLIAVLDACESAADLKRVFDSPACEEGTYGEAPFHREVAEATAAKARSWTKPSDVAGATMWLTRIAAFAPNRVIQVHPDAPSSDAVKSRVAKVLEKELDVLRERCADKASTVRVASAHALACCRNTRVADVGLLEAQWKDEKNKSALATVVLAVGVVARRCSDKLSDDRISAIRQRAMALFDHADLLVRLCAVASVGLLDPELPPRAVEVLSEAIASPKKLPPQWGWFWLSRRDDTSHFAAELCGWVRSAEPGPLVDTLLAARERLPRLTALTDALMRLVFPDLPASGIALEELNDNQRSAVESLAKHEHDDWESRLGLWGRHGPSRFLAGEHMAWRALDVATESGPRRWHFNKIWYARRDGELSETHAVAAIVEGMDGPQEVVDVVLDEGLATTEAEQRLALAIFERLQEDGLDVVTAATEARNRFDRGEHVLPALARFGAYRVRGETLPVEHDQLVVEAVGYLESSAPFDELLEGLSEHRRERIVIASTEDVRPQWEWCGIHVAHVAFTDAVARFMVDRVTRVPAQLDAAIQVLRRTGEAGRRLVATLDLEDAAHRATRDKLHCSALGATCSPSSDHGET